MTEPTTPMTQAGRALLSVEAMDGWQMTLYRAIRAIEAEAITAERARIAAAVEERRDHENSLALRPDIPRSVSEDAASRATAYAAVLAIVKEPV